jgi:hypothetical protein
MVLVLVVLVLVVLVVMPNRFAFFSNYLRYPLLTLSNNNKKCLSL